jgi:hypothetical protein
MRNLKKVLSLVLALVMTMSLATGAFAATAATTTAATTGTTTNDLSGIFTDAAQITNVKEVALLNSLGILSGTDGKFDPTGTLTRAQAAKIVCYVLLGTDVATSLDNVTTATTFTDMKGSEWANGYVQYASTMGIINGVGDNKFDPTAKVTTYQLAKMLLCALGYGQNGEYTGTTWATSVAVDAVKYGILTKGTTNVDCTRDAAALYTYKALFINQVNYADGKYVDYTNKIVGNLITSIPSKSFGEENYGLEKCYGDVVYATVNKVEGFYLHYGYIDDKANTTKYAYAAIGDLNGLTVSGHEGMIWLQNDKTVVTDVVITDAVLGTSTNGTSITTGNDKGLTDYTKTNKAYVADLDANVDVYVNGEVFTDTTPSAVGDLYVVDTNAGAGVANVLYYCTTWTSAAVFTGVELASYRGVSVQLVDNYVNAGSTTTYGQDGDVDAIMYTFYHSGIVTGAVATTTDPDLGTMVKIPGVFTSYTANILGYDKLVKGDVVLYATMADGNTYVTAAKSTDGLLNSITAADGPNPISYKVAGTAYQPAGFQLTGTYNSTTSFGADSAAVGATVTVYTDLNGYVVYAKTVAAANVNVPYIYGVTTYTAAGADKYSNNVTWMQGVLTDGTVVEYQIGDAVTAGSAYVGVPAVAGYNITPAAAAGILSTATMFDYKIYDGKIFLKAVDAGAAATAGAVSMTPAATILSTDKKLTGPNSGLTNYFDTNVKFVYVNGSGATLKATVATGVQAVASLPAATLTTPVAKAILADNDKDGVYTVVAVIVPGASASVAADTVYVGDNTASAAVSYTKANGTVGTAYAYTGYIKDAKTTIYCESAPAANAFSTYSIYKSTEGYSIYTTNTIAIPANYGVVTGEAVKTIYNNMINTTTPTFADYDVSSATITDLVNTAPGATKVDSISAIKDGMASGQTFTIAMTYNASTKTVVNIYITTISSAAVATAPVFTTNLPAVAYAPVAPATQVLTIVATNGGVGALTYQWYSNTTASTTGGTAIALATAASYTTPATVQGTTTYYYCVVTSTSTNATTGVTTTVSTTSHLGTVTGA